MSQVQPRFGAIQIAILLLTIVTALIHLFLGVLFIQSPDGFLGLLFFANGIGYLGLLGLLYLPLAGLASYRGSMRWALIIFTAVTIIAWLFAGSRDLLGYATKVIEVVLIILLFMEGRESL